MVAAVLGDEVPDVSRLSSMLPIPKQNYELGYMRLSFKTFDFLELLYAVKGKKKAGRFLMGPMEFKGALCEDVRIICSWIFVCWVLEERGRK